MGLILAVIVVVVAAAAFVLLRQGSAPHQANAVLSLAAGAIVLIGFLTLPWVRLDGIGELLSWSSPLLFSQLDRLIDNPEITNQLRRLLESAAGISGWRLATDIPTVSEGLRAVLLLIMGAGGLAIVGGGLGVIGHFSARAVGIFQAVSNTLAAIALLFSLSRIRTLGFDPGVLSSLLSIGGLVLASGVWITLLGLIVGTIGGLLLNLARPVRPRRQRRY